MVSSTKRLQEILYSSPDTNSLNFFHTYFGYTKTVLCLNNGNEPLYTDLICLFFPNTNILVRPTLCYLISDSCTNINWNCLYPASPSN